MRKVVHTAVCLLAATLASCDRPPDSGTAADPPPTGSAARIDDEALVHAAATIVAFLKGDTTLDAFATADTITLLVSPEGGGAKARVPRDSLRSPVRWRVRSATGSEYAFAPPAAASRMTTRPGSHINCREAALTSVAPELSYLPHVGVKLEPPDATSCLQAWNVTFVFAADAPVPTLIAAVYDQWEW